MQTAAATTENLHPGPLSAVPGDGRAHNARRCVVQLSLGCNHASCPAADPPLLSGACATWLLQTDEDEAGRLR